MLRNSKSVLGTQTKEKGRVRNVLTTLSFALSLASLAPPLPIPLLPDLLDFEFARRLGIRVTLPFAFLFVPNELVKRGEKVGGSGRGGILDMVRFFKLLFLINPVELIGGVGGNGSGKGVRPFVGFILDGLGGGRGRGRERGRVGGIGKGASKVGAGGSGRGRGSFFVLFGVLSFGGVSSELSSGGGELKSSISRPMSIALRDFLDLARISLLSAPSFSVSLSS